MKKLPIVRWFDDLKSALSIYIADNVAPSPNGVTAGKFYFWKGKVRFPTYNIGAGETLTDSNMPVVPEGGLNKVNEKIGSLLSTAQAGSFNFNGTYVTVRYGMNEIIKTNIGLKSIMINLEANVDIPSYQSIGTYASDYYPVSNNVSIPIITGDGNAYKLIIDRSGSIYNSGKQIPAGTIFNTYVVYY